MVDRGGLNIYQSKGFGNISQHLRKLFNPPSPLAQFHIKLQYRSTESPCLSMEKCPLTLPCKILRLQWLFAKAVLQFQMQWVGYECNTFFVALQCIKNATWVNFTLKRANLPVTWLIDFPLELQLPSCHYQFKIAVQWLFVQSELRSSDVLSSLNCGPVTFCPVWILVDGPVTDRQTDRQSDAYERMSPSCISTGQVSSKMLCVACRGRDPHTGSCTCVDMNG